MPKRKYSYELETSVGGIPIGVDYFWDVETKSDPGYEFLSEREPRENENGHFSRVFFGKEPLRLHRRTLVLKTEVLVDVFSYRWSPCRWPETPGRSRTDVQRGRRYDLWAFHTQKHHPPRHHYER